ncbi:MAG TPA: zf-HC2 domain-containing protein [Terriglobales bacterium]|nr:zf-HC2 domain-containing protein [Terriglobales bacterium]
MAAELPKSVRDRLQAAQAGALPHLDADLLTAFAENSLLEHERATVLAHLAVCPDCRDIVLLAQPELESNGPVLVLKKQRTWFEWKLFRVGAAVAAVAIVAVAVLLHRAPTRSGLDDTSFAKPPVAEQHVEPQTAPRSDSGDESTRMFREAQPPQPPRSKTKLREYTAAREDSESNESGQQAKKGVLEDRFAIDATASAPPPPPVLNKNSAPIVAPPLANAVGGVLNEVRPTLKAAPVPAPSSTRAERMTVPTAPSTRAEQVTVQAAAEANVAQEQHQKVGSQVQTAPLAMRQGTQVTFQRGMASQWRITDAGHLQRFIADQDWRTIFPGGQSDFRAVASAGNHVWVGGSSGLFHSSDNGEHWRQVHIGGTETKGIGEITSIRMSSATELIVHTASGEVWLTRNGGKSWSLQNNQ